MTADPKPTITPEEMQRRRVHVRVAIRVAISENRLEGIATSAETLAIYEAICEAYIRGEIEAGDLVAAYLKRPGPDRPPQPA